MKYLLLTAGLLLAVFSFAQEQKTFETEYARIMAVAKQWEATPDHIVSISHRNYRNGRKIVIKTILKNKEDTHRWVAYERIQKIKFSKSGVSREKVTMFSAGRGYKIGQLKKLNDKYLVVKLKLGGASDYNILLLEKFIVISEGKPLGGKSRREYYIKK